MNVSSFWAVESLAALRTEADWMRDWTDFCWDDLACDLAAADAFDRIEPVCDARMSLS